MSKKNTAPVMDERQMQINSKAWNITGAFFALCLLLSLV